MFVCLIIGMCMCCGGSTLFKALVTSVSFSMLRILKCFFSFPECSESCVLLCGILFSSCATYPGFLWCLVLAVCTHLCYVVCHVAGGHCCLRLGCVLSFLDAMCGLCLFC